MIKVDLPSRLVGVSFSHPTVKKVVPTTRMSMSPEVTRRTTHCEVWELSADNSAKPKLIAHSIVTTHYLDTFKRGIGRKVALTRALKFTNLTKFERMLVWETYHNRGVEGLTLELEKQLRDEMTIDNAADDDGMVINDALGG